MTTWMRFETEPQWRQNDYDSMERSSMDLAPAVGVLYEHMTQPRPLSIGTSYDYRFRRPEHGDSTPASDGDGWILECRSAGQQQMPWQYVGRVVGDPLPQIGVDEFSLTAGGNISGRDVDSWWWELRPAYVDKPSGTCDP